MPKTTVTARSTYSYSNLGRTGSSQFRPLEVLGGEVQWLYFEYTNNTGGTLGSGSVIGLGIVNSRCVVLPNGIVRYSAFGASRTLDIGTQEYTHNGTTYAAVADNILDGLDVSSAGLTQLISVATTGNVKTASTVANGKLVLNGGTEILATTAGGTIPNGATLQLWLPIIPISG